MNVAKTPPLASRSATASTRWRKRINILVIYALAILVLIAFVGPLVWFATLSFKTRLEIFAWPPQIIDLTPTLGNYSSLFSSRIHFQSFILNSLGVALISTALALGVGVTAAYALARNRLGRSGWIAFSMLSFRMLPPISLAVPYYLIFRQLGMLGTLPAIALTHTVFSLAIVIWMMRSFFEKIPQEIEEAAFVDGCTPWQVFAYVTVPLSKAALAASAIFAFLTSWNEFLFAVLLSSPQTKTVPVAVSTFVGEVYVSWGELAGATIIGLLPALLFAFIGQRYLLLGLAPGSVK